MPIPLGVVIFLSLIALTIIFLAIADFLDKESCKTQYKIIKVWYETKTRYCYQIRYNLFHTLEEYGSKLSFDTYAEAEKFICERKQKFKERDSKKSSGYALDS